eukprot:COSAG02_NODE_4078_length_5809_cov_1.830363_6_plen_193_part_00
MNAAFFHQDNEILNPCHPRARRDRVLDLIHARARPRTIRKENSTRAARTPAVGLHYRYMYNSGSLAVRRPLYHILPRAAGRRAIAGCTAPVHVIGCPVRGDNEASTALASRARQAFIRATRRRAGGTLSDVSRGHRQAAHAQHRTGSTSPTTAISTTRKLEVGRGHRGSSEAVSELKRHRTAPALQDNARPQ